MQGFKYIETDIIGEMKRNSVLLLYTRHAFLGDNDNSSIYKRIKADCDREFELRSINDNQKFFRKPIERIRYFRRFEEALSESVNMVSNWNYFTEIPFSFYFSFDENYILREKFKKSPYQFEDWLFSNGKSLGKFIHNFEYSENQIPIVVSLFSNLGNRNSINKIIPTLTNGELFQIAKTVLEVPDSLRTISKRISQIDTIVILGLDLNDSLSSLYKYLINRIIMDKGTPIGNNIFFDEEFLEKVASSNSDIGFTFNEGNQQFIFVPFSKTKIFLKQ